MKRTLSIFAWLLALGCLCPSPALAYLDPGTGSMLVSALIGIAATLFFVLKNSYYKIINLFYSLAGRSVPRGGGELVFYCEGKQYWNTFKPLLEECEARGIRAVYLCSDAGDPGLQREWGHISPRFIGMGNKGFAVMNMLEADICVTTTPGLDVLQIHRSPGVKHYVHLVHSMTDMAIYRLFSFDYFDSIMTSGAHQIKSLRHLEELRRTPQKQCFETGCPYMDVLADEMDALKAAPANAMPEAAAGPHILIAPTWGRNGLFTRFGAGLVLPLAQAGFSITLRPHPQSLTSEKEVIEALRQAVGPYPNVRWDNDPSPFSSMFRSDVLVSDLSAIVFDYAFILERPVVTVKFTPDLRGLEASDLPWTAWELDILPQLGAQLEPENIHTLPQVLSTLPLAEDFAQAMRILRPKHLFNYRQSGRVAVDQLMQIKQALGSKQ